MATRKIGPALAAGCTVVLKPASETPLTALLIAQDPGRGRRAGGRGERAARAPVRRGRLCGAGRPAGAQAVLHRFDRGRPAAAQGGGRPGRQRSMELGGNAPFIVFDDADLDAAIEGAMVAKMRNGGQACTAANRFLVQAPVAEEFSRRLAERMGAVRVGPGTDDGTQLGRWSTRSRRDKVDELVGRGRRPARASWSAARARTARASTTQPPCCVDVPPGAAILREEIFGPVAPIVTFDRRGRGDRARQRHRVRAGLLRLHRRPRPRPARQRAAGVRHGRAQPRPRLRPRRPLRRHQAVAASAARAGTRGCWTTWRASTSP